MNNKLKKMVRSLDELVLNITLDKLHPSYSCIGHVVLGDDNLDDGFIDWCLDEERLNTCVAELIEDVFKSDPDIDIYRDPDWQNYDYYDLILGIEITIAFLKFLRTIPEDKRYG